jgi:hypothetical protein
MTWINDNAAAIQAIGSVVGIAIAIAVPSWQTKVARGGLGEMEQELPEQLSAAQIEKFYREAREAFDACIRDAKLISQRAAGRRTTHPKEFWASVLFTRLVVTSLSILRLAPRAAPITRRNAHWDFSGVASLVRNLAEGYFIFFYLCVDKVEDDDEWMTRLNLIQLRDNNGRYRMFKEWDPEDTQLEGFKQLEEELRQKLKARTHFISLPPKRQAELLKGDKDPMPQDEILARMGEDKAWFRGLYRFLVLIHTQRRSPSIAWLSTGVDMELRTISTRGTWPPLWRSRKDL